MKKILLLCLTALVIQSCGINQQTRQLKALEKCTYDITMVDSIYIAGADVSRMIANKNIDKNRLPGIALGMLRKNIPLEARVNFKINNPTADLAAVNQFEYIIQIKGQDIANGFVNQKITVEPGGSTTVPVRLNSNIYSFLSNGKTMNDIFDFISGGSDKATEKKGIITLKIKPSMMVGKRLVKYPGYITIDKEVSSKILF